MSNLANFIIAFRVLQLPIAIAYLTISCYNARGGNISHGSLFFGFASKSSAHHLQEMSLKSASSRFYLDNHHLDLWHMVPSSEASSPSKHIAPKFPTHSHRGLGSPHLGRDYHRSHLRSWVVLSREHRSNSPEHLLNGSETGRSWRYNDPRGSVRQASSFL